MHFFIWIYYYHPEENYTSEGMKINLTDRVNKKTIMKKS